MVYKETRTSCKESFYGQEKNPQRTPNSFFVGFFMKPRRISYWDLTKQKPAKTGKEGRDLKA
jgi:hypothetical protein